MNRLAVLLLLSNALALCQSQPPTDAGGAAAPAPKKQAGVPRKPEPPKKADPAPAGQADEDPEIPTPKPTPPAPSVHTETIPVTVVRKSAAESLLTLAAVMASLAWALFAFLSWRRAGRLVDAAGRTESLDHLERDADHLNQSAQAAASEYQKLGDRLADATRAPEPPLLPPPPPPPPRQPQASVQRTQPTPPPMRQPAPPPPRTPPRPSILAEYAQARASGDDSRFVSAYPVTGISCGNLDDYRYNTSIQLRFNEASRGFFLLVQHGGELLIFPKVTLDLGAERVRLEGVYQYPEAGTSFRLEKPAKAATAGNEWLLAEPGVIAEDV